MKKITPQDVRSCLEALSGRVTVPEAIRVPALNAVKRMIAVSR